MFCSNCGNEIKDGEVFCPKCGTAIENSNSNQKAHISSDFQGQNTNSASSLGNNPTGTRYASTALIFAVVGLVLWCFCGIQLLAGFPAIVFGALAVRNKDPEIEKAYIAIGIGVLDIVLFAVLFIVGANR